MSDELNAAEEVKEQEIQPSGEAQPGEPNVTPDPAALQSEIQRLEEIKKKAEEDARYWRQEKARARGEYFRSKQEDVKATPPPDEIGPPPSKEQFDDYDKFVEAKIQYATKLAEIKWEKQQAQKQVEEATQQKTQKLQEKLNLGFQEFPDFEEVVYNETVPITPVVVDILSETENPHRIAYYLAKNRLEAIQISRMTPVQAARAIAKIETTLANEPMRNNPQNKIVSQAPPPINALGSGNAGIEKDPSKMTQREYEEWRIRTGAKRF